MYSLFCHGCGLSKRLPRSGTSAGMTTGEGNKDVKEDHDVKDNEDAVKEKDAEADERKCLNN